CPIAVSTRSLRRSRVITKSQVTRYHVRSSRRQASVVRAVGQFALWGLAAVVLLGVLGTLVLRHGPASTAYAASAAGLRFARRTVPTRPLGTLSADVEHRPSQPAAHAPRRRHRRRCRSARARRRFFLRWFRSRKSSEEQAPVEAAAPQEAPKPVIAEPADEAG